MSSASENQTIGPYRVIGSLGKGGMGEVLLAKDPRLHRKVAIKQIRGGEHPEARKRFQREARLAASLSHASIVSIFDFVEQEDHEYLVMELVDGPSLKVWLEGNVSFEEKLRVAEQIAAGLQYAHRFGVVHRDLKTENVLITPEGQAKIADFGVARRFRATDELAGDETADANTRDRTELLTREGALLGTYRSMSPEQAQGERADFRSDLFSFGVLLFEMFAGFSPFQAEKPLDTLINLVSHPHPELDQVAPGLPHTLVRLIDQLLEKDRDLRPRSADEVLQQLRQVRRAMENADSATVGTAGSPASRSPGVRSGSRRRLAWFLTLLVLASAGSLFWMRSPSEIEVAVLRPKCEGGPCPEGLDLWARHAIQESLLGLQGVAPKSPSEIDGMLAAVSAGTSVAFLEKSVGVNEIVEPVLTCTTAGCSYLLSRREASSQRVIGITSAQLDDLSPYMIKQSVDVRIRELFPERRLKNRKASQITQKAYDRAIEIWKKLQAPSGAENLESMLGEIREIRKGSANFPIAVNIEVDIARRLYRMTNNAKYIDEAALVVKEALEEEPEDEVPLRLTAIWLFTSLGQIEKAEEELKNANASSPNDQRLIEMRAYLLEMKGEYEDALRERRRALQLGPTWTRRFGLAYGLVNAFQWGEARTVLDALLAEAPDYLHAEKLRARLELKVGDAKNAIERYTKFLERTDDLASRSELASAYILAGDANRAAQELERVLEEAPENPYFLWSLAEARDLQGRHGAAEELCRRVIAVLEAESEAQRAVVDSLIARALAYAYLAARSESPMERDKAVILLEQAEGKVPQRADQIALEAAVVYTLLNDHSVAANRIRKLRDQGRELWLCLPPFQALRSKPQFSSLIPPANECYGIGLGGGS